MESQEERFFYNRKLKFPQIVMIDLKRTKILKKSIVLHRRLPEQTGIRNARSQNNTNVP